MNRSKTPHLARERWKLWTKKHNKGWSYNWIGKHYGYDHTSVLYGIKKLQQENIKAYKKLVNKMLIKEDIMGLGKAYYMSVCDLIDWNKSLQENKKNLVDATININGLKMPVLTSTIEEVWKSENEKEESYYKQELEEENNDTNKT